MCLSPPLDVHNDVNNVKATSQRGQNNKKLSSLLQIH
jgi:hypothetical protein